MIFTPDQIDELGQIIERYNLLFVAEHVSPEVLTKRDRATLKSFGIDLDKVGKKRLIEEAYKFGILSNILASDKVKGMDYKEFKKYLTEGRFVPLNEEERNALKALEYYTYSDIKGLGNRWIDRLKTFLIDKDKKQREIYEKIIKDEVAKGIQDRKTIAEIARELGKRTGDWARDFGRIADFVMHTAFDEGRAAAFARDEQDPLVYKDVYPGACKHCIELYTTGGLGTAPIVFRLSELRANGTNVGKKVDEWLPVIGPVHPWCRCTLNKVPKGMKWNPKTGTFQPPTTPVDHPFGGKPEEPGTGYQRKVQRKSKIKVKVGEKEFVI
jgi:hypothetical protein